MAAEFVTALREAGNQYVNISEFQSLPGIGLACGCKCPECGRAVGARIWKEAKSSSFFHLADEDNRTCTGGGTETDLHLLAKKIFEVHKELFLPDLEKGTTSFSFPYTSSRFENRRGNIRPDVILFDDEGRELMVELTVTHKTFNNVNKMNCLKQLGTPAIEITLDTTLTKWMIKADEVLDFPVISRIYGKAVVEEIKNKIWLVKPAWSIKQNKSVDDTSAAETDYSWVIPLLVTFLIGYFIYKRFCRRKKLKRK